MLAGMHGDDIIGQKVSGPMSATHGSTQQGDGTVPTAQQGAEAGAWCCPYICPLAPQDTALSSIQSE